MQMMLSKSYEFGEIDGLDVISGNVVKIPNENKKNKELTKKDPNKNKKEFKKDATNKNKI